MAVRDDRRSQQQPIESIPLMSMLILHDLSPAERPDGRAERYVARPVFAVIHA